MSWKEVREDYGVSLNLVREPKPCFKVYQKNVGLLDEEIHAVKGKLHSLSRVMRQGDSGEFEMFYFNFIRDGERFSFAVSNSLMRGLVNTLLSIDLDKEVRISPYTKEYESKNGKKGKNKLFYISQDGEMVKWSVSRDEQQSLIKDNKKADGTIEKDYSLMNKHFSDLFNDLAKTLLDKREKEVVEAYDNDQADEIDFIGEILEEEKGMLETAKKDLKKKKATKKEAEDDDLPF